MRLMRFRRISPAFIVNGFRASPDTNGEGTTCSRYSSKRNDWRFHGRYFRSGF
ncbi:MAG TPA: hypothetical protein DEF41_06775 [Desulfovibrio sp.]|nr:hypothetical protein [Desulfovibrio sp.]